MLSSYYFMEIDFSEVAFYFLTISIAKCNSMFDIFTYLTSLYHFCKVCKIFLVDFIQKHSSPLHSVLVDTKMNYKLINL